MRNPIAPFYSDSRFFISILCWGLASGCGSDGNNAPDATAPTDGPAIVDATSPDSSPADASIADAATPVGNSSALWAGHLSLGPDEEIILFDGLIGIPFPIPGVTAIDKFYNMAVSPNGERIAVGLKHDGGTSQLIVANLDGTGVTTLVVDYAQTARFKSIVWSPDGSHIAFTSDIFLPFQDAAYVVPSDGSLSPVRISPITGDIANDAKDLRWFSNTQVVFRGNFADRFYNTHYISDISTSPITPSPLVPENLVLDSGSTIGPADFANGKIYLKSEHLGGASLFSVDPDGSNLEIAPFFNLTNERLDARLGTFAVSPDGTTIAFSADAPTENIYQVYVAPLNGTATLQSNFDQKAPASGTSGASQTLPIAWSPDQSMLAVVGDWTVTSPADNDNFSAFLIPSSGPAGGIRIWKPRSLINNQDVGKLLFSSDSSALYGSGDLMQSGRTEVFMTKDFSTSDQSVELTRVEEVPLGSIVVQLITLP